MRVWMYQNSYISIVRMHISWVDPINLTRTNYNKKVEQSLDDRLIRFLLMQPDLFGSGVGFEKF